VVPNLRQANFSSSLAFDVKNVGSAHTLQPLL